MGKIKGIKRRILEKYLEPKLMDKEDERLIERMASIGLMNTGVDLYFKKRTARTTKNGYSCIR
jgi:hypothetical protein